MTSGEFESATSSRRDSRKRRRLSERRRVFSRIGVGTTEQRLLAGSLSSERTWSQQSSANNTADLEQPVQPFPSRADSPLADNSKISMKIQFHITLAPDNEPLLLDSSQLELLQSGSSSSASILSARSSDGLAARQRRQQSTDSIGDQIHERLSRQSSSSQRKRQQLLALHNQTALDTSLAGKFVVGTSNSNNNTDDDANLSHSLPEELGVSGAPQTPVAIVDNGAREPGARSSTITGGMADEATERFLARHRQQVSLSRTSPVAASLSAPISREHIYFKRDGQRFGHEFTLKLSVARTYRCLLKVRPLIPLQAISIQGHQVLFMDCSQTADGGPPPGSSQSAPASALTSSVTLNRSWNNIRSNSNYTHHHQQASRTHQQTTFATTTNKPHRLNHAQTSANLSYTGFNKQQHQQQQPQTDCRFLYQQQQSQMMRHFAASHCSSSSSAHLGSQLIYMFDWSANRFEVNKNKARTQLQTVLKFKNGQILSLPLQVKFYQPDCKQHLSWGSQLHFIDYDCNINNMGQINVERVHYY